MGEPILDKLAFNGYNVTFLNHEGRNIEENSFPTIESVMARGFEDGFPGVDDFVDGLYTVYGDTVGMVKDNAGVVLYDNMVEMNDEFKDPMFR